MVLSYCWATAWFYDGLGTMMRGAHFLSHNLWTGWIILCFNTACMHTSINSFEQQKQSTLSKDISALPSDD